jgi:hypothetical protein
MKQKVLLEQTNFGDCQSMLMGFMWTELDWKNDIPAEM